MDRLTPGFVPKVLRNDAVSFLRPDERVFDAMLDGWSAQMLARGLQVSTIENRLRVIRRFQGFSETFPWSWQPVDFDDYMAERRSGDKPIHLTTLRTESNTVAMFCSFLCSPAYGWAELCQATFGDIPSQICFQWNTPRHTADDALPPGRRAFTQTELQRLFDVLDDQVDAAQAKGSKRWLTLFRNSMAFKLCYAYGLRRNELAMLDVQDFGPNPHVPDYGMYGALKVRWAKGTAASGPRRRDVMTVPEFEWSVQMMRVWTSPGGRDRFPTAEQSSALWPSERGDRIAAGTLSDAFTVAREAAGLPQELSLHCLRYSYVTHLIEAGADPLFVQTQVGHSSGSTTSLYTSVSADFKQKTIQKMIARRLANPEEIIDG